MKKQSSIDRIAYAARDGELSIDAAIAAVTGKVLADPFLREAVVKWMIAQIMMGKSEWDEPPLAKMIVDLKKIEAWLVERKEAGKRIDPDNAEVTFRWALTHDPYGVWPDITDRERQVGQEYFARTPGGDDGWVWFDDLPDATLKELRRKMDAGEGEGCGGAWRSRKKAKSA